MKIAFLGAVDFSRHCLEVIREVKGNLVGIFTLDPAKAARYGDFIDLETLARAWDVPLFRMVSIHEPPVIAQLKNLKPDVLFVFGWSQLVPPEILAIPRLGCIGSHPALLPKHRGRHPLIWALVEGLSESGLTFFYMGKGADDGDILWQQSFSITIGDTAGTLYEKIKQLAARAIPEFLPRLADGTAPRRPQNHIQASYWRKRTEADGEIHWGDSSLKIYNLVRALTRPYVGAHTWLDGKKVLIWKTGLLDTKLAPGWVKAKPGTIFTATDQELQVRTGDGFLTLREYELAEGERLQAGFQLGDQS